jgi:AGZA family xanthine/uracil permease-like MFS transporter
VITIGAPEEVSVVADDRETAEGRDGDDQPGTEARPGERGPIDRLFGLSEQGSTVGRETVAGVTTFLAMAYILGVNPSILGETGMDVAAVFVATGLAAALGTLIMGLWARYPIALAPGMGLNAFFAFTVVLTFGIPWQTALAGTLVSGVLFFLLAATGIRAAIINAIPLQLKLATGAGIGVFIAFIGLKNAGIVAEHDETLVTLGNLTRPETVLAAFGVLVTASLLVRGLRGGVFYGMVVTAVAGVATGLIDPPDRIVSAVPSLAPTFGEAITNLPELLTAQMIIVVFTMLFVDFFDTSGTLIAIANQAGFLRDGTLPRANRALMSDSIATMGGAVLGTSTTTSYIESAAGVGAGGRRRPGDGRPGGASGPGCSIPPGWRKARRRAAARRSSPATGWWKAATAARWRSGRPIATGRRTPIAAGWPSATTRPGSSSPCWCACGGRTWRGRTGWPSSKKPMKAGWRP